MIVEPFAVPHCPHSLLTSAALLLWWEALEHQGLDAQARLERQEAAERARKAKKAAAKEAKMMSLSITQQRLMLCHVPTRCVLFLRLILKCDRL